MSEERGKAALSDTRIASRAAEAAYELKRFGMPVAGMPKGVVTAVAPTGEQIRENRAWNATAADIDDTNEIVAFTGVETAQNGAHVAAWLDVDGADIIARPVTKLATGEGTQHRVSSPASALMRLQPVPRLDLQAIAERN
jgi:hypothetical protein